MNACKNLKNNSEASQTYMKLLNKIYNLAAKDAQIIIHDCSRYNFYNLISIKNPFDPNIDWETHQSPYFWMRLLKQVGFDNKSLRWTTFNPLRTLGKLILGNPIAAYFITSSFCLTVRKP